jgi:hypothetical protein
MKRERGATVVRDRVARTRVLSRPPGRLVLFLFPPFALLARASAFHQLLAVDIISARWFARFPAPIPATRAAKRLNVLYVIS